MSGGQLQRLALARALAPRTELLIADDVSSALDVTTELDLWRALRDKGVTVIGSTSKRAALAQADRVVVLLGGEAVAQGTWRESRGPVGPPGRLRRRAGPRYVGCMLTHCECPRCGLTYDARTILGVCSCGSPLLCRYDLDTVRDRVQPAQVASRATNLWRYRELLPVRDSRHVVTLGEGMDPDPAPALLTAPRIGVPGLLVKRKGSCRPAAFKARGAAVGVSRARELGIDRITMPTNGNAGAAWATYAARAGMASLGSCCRGRPRPSPAWSAPWPALGLYIVDGLIGDAGPGSGRAQAVGHDGSSTPRHSRSPTASRARRPWAWRSSSSSGWRDAGRASCTRPAAAWGV